MEPSGSPQHALLEGKQGLLLWWYNRSSSGSNTANRLGTGYRGEGNQQRVDKTNVLLLGQSSRLHVQRCGHVAMRFGWACSGRNAGKARSQDQHTLGFATV